MADKKQVTILGRPPLIPYSDALADEICFRMMNGRHLASICEDPDMPGKWSVYRWMDRFPEFATRISRAREALADHYAGKILDAAETIQSGDDVQVEAFKTRAWMWATSKFGPRQYSDRVIGAERAAQVNVQINNGQGSVDLSHMTDEEKAELRRLLEKARNPIGLIEGE